MRLTALQSQRVYRLDRRPRRRSPLRTLRLFWRRLRTA